RRDDRWNGGGAASQHRSARGRVPQRGRRRASAGSRCAMVTPVEDLGWSATRFVVDLGRLALFGFQVVRAALAPPLRVRRFVQEVFKLGVLSLIIISVCGLAVGMLLSPQGYLVGVGLMGVDPGAYMSSLQSAVDFRDDVVGGLLKALIFGVLVGLIATYRGFTAAPTSAGVGAATTSTVVGASVSILIFDYVITALWGA